MNLWNTTTENRNGATEKLMIAMRRYAGVSRRNYSMKLSSKSTRTI